MLQKELLVVINAIIKRMKDEGYSQQMSEKNRWIFQLFQQYCEAEDFTDIQIWLCKIVCVFGKKWLLFGKN